MPWAEMLRAALRLGIPPEAFWRLSLREWRWLTAADTQAGRFDCAQLDALIKDYPDETGTET